MKKKREEEVAIYHVVRANEDFDRTASYLLQLIQEAQDQKPGKNRTLYLDIEGHRNASGGFDLDMFELQTKFATEFLMQFLNRIEMPLATIKNPKQQKNDIPAALNIFSFDENAGSD